MLLAVDVGNTNTVIGVFNGSTLVAHWRLETRAERTGDEHAATLFTFFQLAGLDWRALDSAILATVVPSIRFAIESLCKTHLRLTPLIVGPGIRSGMPILYDNPREVGADRIVNAVAAYEKHRQGCIVVDFGTATTFDVVTPKGEYLGGTIAPGLAISAEALYDRAAKLPRVEIARPKGVIGKNTVASMQAGLYFGYVGLVDELVRRTLAEVDFPARVIATGGLASLIAPDSKTIEACDELLTLTGLRILYERNREKEPG